MVTLSFAAVVCVLGLIVFLATKNNPDVKRIGEIGFFVGLAGVVWFYANVLFR